MKFLKILFVSIPRSLKTLEMNFMKDIQGLTLKTIKTFLEEILKDRNKWRYFHHLENSILLQCLFSPKWSIDLTVPIKILTNILVEVDHFLIKFVCKGKELLTAITIIKKNEIEELKLILRLKKKINYLLITKGITKSLQWEIWCPLINHLVVVNFMCQLGWVIIPRCLVKHYSGYISEGVFWVRLRLK